MWFLDQNPPGQQQLCFGLRSRLTDIRPRVLIVWYTQDKSKMNQIFCNKNGNPWILMTSYHPSFLFPHLIHPGILFFLHLLKSRHNHECCFDSENMTGLCFSPEYPQEPGFDVLHCLFSLHDKNRISLDMEGVMYHTCCWSTTDR